VLLIDDDELVRRCTVRMLSEFEVITAASGVEALGIFEQDTDFDVVLSDVMMPGMSGADLFALCYRKFPTLAQRFVFASGNPDPASAELRSVIGALHLPHEPILLAKPTSREALLLALFATAAQGASRSGTYSAFQAGQAEVTKRRG
jgi:CheY-like chemotaxis protein